MNNKYLTIFSLGKYLVMLTLKSATVDFNNPKEGQNQVKTPKMLK